jgi:hypothetical protein
MLAGGLRQDEAVGVSVLASAGFFNDAVRA